MRNKVFITLFLIVILFKVAYPQENKIIFEIRAGVSYIPMWEQSELWGTLTNAKQYSPSFNSELLAGYNFSSKHSLRVAIGYIESKVEASSINGKVDWNYKGYPLSLIYQYNFYLLSDILQPYLSGGFSFYWSEVEQNVEGSIERLYDYKRNETGLGLEGGIGLSIKLLDKLNMLSEFQLRISNASLFSEESKYGSIEFTGVYLLFGINYNI
ncbi:MAG: outer membrane beta-barrel protein [Ignavibacteriaceae bacterium]|nr:outer membrane beta-barrel protein [Ignavibacteriaceae bacterium]